jgi:hypothetical protein
MQSNKRPRARLLLIGLLLGLALSYSAWARHRYTVSSPRFCESCHKAQDGSRWHAGEHKDHKCQTCHLTPTGALVVLGVFGLAGKKKDLPRHGAAASSTCVSCHRSSKKGWADLTSKGSGHERHAKVKGTECLTCHAEHKRGFAEASCTPKCHQPATLHPNAPAADSCLSCHLFGASPRAMARTAERDCQHCHGDTSPYGATGKFAPVSTQVLHGRSECGGCHEPHGKRTLSRTADEGTRCKECHDLSKTGLAEAAMKAMPEGHRVCSKCHQEHSPLKSATSTCGNCHEDYVVLAKAEVPSRKRTHKTRSTEKPLGDERGKNSPGSTTAMRHEGCATCHQPHSFKNDPKSCVNCHDKEATQIRTSSPKQHEACDKCHKSHSVASATSFCGACHAPINAVSASASPRHKDCNACHLPHAATRQNARGVCNQCHRPVIDLPTHKGACASCHATHGSAVVARALCLKCHDAKVHFRAPANARAKHAQCSTCHAPHVNASGAAHTCTSCHAKEARTSHDWPANSAHSQACGRCHASHIAGGIIATCASCHGKEAASSKGDRHKCKDCHAAHESPPGTGAAWWSSCQKCHSRETAAVKPRGPTHSNCSKCHESHRFASTPCQSCHSDIKSKGGHAIKEHGRCRSCHDSHAKTPIMRNQCLGACHKDQRNHEVDGPRCQACHGFQ